MARTASRGALVEVEIRPGEAVAVIGTRGTGKTTMMREGLLPGMMPNVTAWDPVVDANGQGQYPAEISYRPSRPDAEAEFEHLCHAINSAKRPWWLLVEEVEQILPELGPKVPPHFKQTAMVGRNYGIGYVLNIRRPAGVSKWALEQCDHWLIFLVRGRSFDYVRSAVGTENRAMFDRMKTWKKDPREGGGRFFHYMDGDLIECDPLDL